jgi:hypothetical protein
MMLACLAIALLVFVTVYSAIVSFRQKPGESAAPSWIFPDGTRRPARIFVGIASLMLLIGLGTWLSINARNSSPRSFRFLIPEGYSGWVRVEFEVPGASILPAEAGQTVVKVPYSGLLRTSSQEQYGWAKDDYLFYSSDRVRTLPDFGSGRLIWGKINAEESGSSGKRKYEEFFVGTEQQFKDQAEQAKPKATPKDSRSPATTP